MTTKRKHTLKRPFMIMREDGDGNDFAKVQQSDLRDRIGWADWDGTRYATNEAAQTVIDRNPDKLAGAYVVEILAETRRTIRV